MSTTYHPQTGDQSERTIKTMEDILQTCVINFEGSWDTHLPLVEFLYNNNYHTSIKCASFEALYGRKCRSPLCWLETGDTVLKRLDIIEETVDKIKTIKERLKTTKNCQRSYADKLRKPLEFQVGDNVLLKLSLWKGMIHFEKRGKLNLRLKHSRILIVKARWNSRRGPEFTWEREDEFKCKYPDLFSSVPSCE
ncbi:putative reverse transcriptase domain-containing protein [Tanacetum coccineum]